MEEPAAPALVSVIVRTTGRPELGRALECVRAQTHRPVEIVLVDAAARGLDMTSYHDIPVRVVATGAPLDRPRAANAGLDAARGGWILFLDEDDEIEPGHLAELLAAARLEHTGVAYSQTRLVDAAGHTQRIFGGPFNAQALKRSNFLAINAVLFAVGMVSDGLRFDELLPIFEDWDFWVHLAGKTTFAFTGKATAIYHAATGQSGAGAAGNLDREAVLAQRDKLLRKWAAGKG